MTSTKSYMIWIIFCCDMVLKMSLSMSKMILRYLNTTAHFLSISNRNVPYMPKKCMGHRKKFPALDK